MTPDAQKILDMIEAVDPTDTAKLDEIDLLVMQYIQKKTYVKGEDYEWILLNSRGKKVLVLVDIDKINYTKSRDALKSIRPENCKFVGIIDDNRFDAHKSFTCFMSVFIDDGDGKIMGEVSGDGKTEELAELHVIIQAIDFERTQ